ncbi:MAG: UrcA family protein [Pseudomonadota bacterium]
MKIALIPALAALAFAAPAMAEQVTTKVAVPSAGLDLQNPADAAVMLGRLDRAAVRACGASSFSVRDYQVAVRHSACYRDAMAQAVNAVKAPALSAAYAQATAVADQ